MLFCSLTHGSLLESANSAGVRSALIRAFQPLDISLMRRAVDVVKQQDRDRNRAEGRDYRKEDQAEVTQDRRVYLARCRMLRKADPREHESRNEGADARDAFRYEAV